MSKEARERLAAALDAAPESQPAASGSAFTDYSRAAFQGLSFGFADEIEAAVKAAFDSGKTYAEVVKDVRGQIESFRQRNPAAAYGTEIAGAILPTIAAQFIPGVGQAVTAGRAQQLAKAAGFGFLSPAGVRTAQVAGTSGAQSALYGLGAAEGNLAERLPSAAASGAIGAVAGPAVAKVAPAITAGAADLIKRGVALTPGQAVGGSSLLGTALQRTEERVADTVPLLGDAVRGAFDRANAGFNRATVSEALGPLVKSIPKNLEGKQLTGYGQRVISNAYNATLSKMKIENVMPLASEINTITKDLRDDIAKDIKDRVSDHIIKKFKNGAISGQDIKKAQTALRKDIINLRKEGSEIGARKADALEDIKNVFSAELQKQNPVQGPKLNQVDKAYGQFEIVRNAELRRKAGANAEGFLPGDLLQAVAKGDPTKRQSQFTAGEARLQKFAQNAQEVMGNMTPNSGTAARLNATKMATGVGGGGALTQADPFTIGATLASPFAYSPVGVPIARNVVAGAGRVARGAVPVAAANTTEMSRQMLADILRR
jgi:hypothetical protein